MIRSLLCAGLFLDAVLAVGAPPVLDLPAEVRPVNGYARLTPKTDAVSIRYVALDGVYAFPSEELKDGRRFVLPAAGLKDGRYRFVAVAAGKTGEQSEAEFVVIVGKVVPPGPGPNPPPGPTPDPDPVDPPAPIPHDGFRVLMVFEKDTLRDLPPGQFASLYSGDITYYLSTKCAKGPDHKTPEWRKWDQNQDLTNATPAMRDAMARPRKSLPWIVVSNGKTGFEGPLPNTPEETLTLLKKYGGE
jgi:hypothetical protein